MNKRQIGGPALGFVLVVLGILGGGGPAAAQGRYPFAAGLSASFGGALDADGENPGLDQLGLQAMFSWDIGDETAVVIRAASINFSDEFLGPLFDPTLQFITIGGEYRFFEGYYESGIYLGLGGYRLEGTVAAGDENDTALGLVLGYTANFPLTKHLSIQGELAAHYADLQGARLFGFLNGGLVVKF